MNMPPSKEPYDGYCGTSYAAKMLGISVGTVQGLVEKNDLKAWKTQGGHRRISLQSIQDYQRRHNLAPASMMQGEDRLRVLVVEDDESTRLMLQANFDQWGLPLDAVMYSSAMEA
jgi:excisionase family DNA binding protein